MKGIVAALFILGILSGSAGADFYDDWMRPAPSKGAIFGFRGQIIELISTSSGYVMRVNVTRDNYRKDAVYVEYVPNKSSPFYRPLANGDVIDVRGELIGVKTYQAVLGQTVSIPHIVACHVNIAGGPGWVTAGDKC